MRLRAFGIASALALAGGAATVTGGIQHVFAACGGTVSAGVVSVYAGSGASQIGAGPNATAVGVCTDTGSPGATGFEGGWAEAGVGNLGSANQGQAYVVLDGNNSNTLSQSSGYVGLSNYETGSKDTGPRDQSGCTDTGGGTSDTNSGGSYGVKQLCFLGGPFATGVTVPTNAVPLPVCGFASGPSWGSTTRDGCWVV